MKIVIAPDSFKGSISAISACEIIEKGIHTVLKDAEVIKLPIADGGEGTVDAFVVATSCKTISAQVKGPLGERVEAKFAVLDDNTGVIEMALASGLTLLNENQRNPMITTSYGTGELIKSALDFGCRKIIIGLGGSATNDGGLGLAQALGYSFKDIDGKELGYGGGEIARLYSIDTSNRDIRLDSCEIVAACDVKNILCGAKGASYVYGPQKGATQEMVALLDENLNHYANIIEKQLNIKVSNISGIGAAGGLGAALHVFCKASIISGVDLILDSIDFDKHIAEADLVITGEGKIDSQSIFGKVPIGVGKRAKKNHIPVIAVVGTIGEGVEAVYDYGIDSVISITDKPMTLECSMLHVETLLFNSIVRLVRIISVMT